MTGKYDKEYFDTLRSQVNKLFSDVFVSLDMDKKTSAQQDACVKKNWELFQRIIVNIIKDIKNDHVWNMPNVFPLIEAWEHQCREDFKTIVIYHVGLFLEC